MGRIVFISSMTGHRWGGSEELWSRTAHALLAMGHQVGASVKRWPDEAAKITLLEQSGCAVHRRRTAGLRRKVDRVIGLLAKTPEDRWLTSFDPHLVVISQGAITDGLPWMQRCRSRGIPYVVIAQQNGELYWPRDDQSRQELATHYESAVACCFVSKRNLDLARIQFASDLPRAIVVRNPFNVPFDLTLPWPSATDGFALACVGRLEPHSKGQDILFEVLGDAKWQERPVRVDLYGTGPCAGTLQVLAKRYGLRNVAFCGQVEDIVGIWRSHHGLVLTSRYEGLPLVVVEAMLCGRPCFVSDVGGSAELIQDGISGVLAAFPTRDAVASALERAWDCREQWPNMGAEAARIVRASVPPDPPLEFAGMLTRFLR